MGIIRLLDYYRISYRDADSISQYLSDKPITVRTLIEVIRSVRESFPHANVEIVRLNDWADYLLLRIDGDFRSVLEKIEEIETALREDLIRMEGWLQITVA